jgi:hypothetical protein
MIRWLLLLLTKERRAYRKIFIAFLRKSGYESLTACTPDDVRRFLVWKDCNPVWVKREI